MPRTCTICRHQQRQEISPIQRERDRLQGERERLEVQLEMRTANETQAAQLEAAIKQFGNRLNRLTFPEQFRLVHDFVERVVVRADGGIELCTFIPVPDRGPAVTDDTMAAGFRPRREYVMAAIRVDRLQRLL